MNQENHTRVDFKMGYWLSLIMTLSLEINRSYFGLSVPKGFSSQHMSEFYGDVDYETSKKYLISIPLW